MATFNISGTFPGCSTVKGAVGSLRTYSTYRYHAGGSCSLKLGDIMDYPSDYPINNEVGIRIGLHQNGNQVGKTLVWDNKTGGRQYFGNIPAGSYAIHGRTVRIKGTGGATGASWSGSLILASSPAPKPS